MSGNGFWGHAAKALFADPVAGPQVVRGVSDPPTRWTEGLQIPVHHAVSRCFPKRWGGRETRPTTSGVVRGVSGLTAWPTEGLLTCVWRDASCSPERVGRSGDAPHNKENPPVPRTRRCPEPVGAQNPSVPRTRRCPEPVGAQNPSVPRICRHTRCHDHWDFVSLLFAHKAA